MSAKPAKQEPTFTEARERLDEILAELEADAGDVDQLAARLKEAAGLIRFCRDRLAAARHEVRKVVAELAPEVPASEAEPEGGGAGDDAPLAKGPEGAGPGGLPF